MITLQKLKELCDKATPGRWVATLRRDHFGSILTEYEIYSEQKDAAGEDIEVCFGDIDASYGPIWEKADAKFIAESRTAIPLLIEEVQRLREALQKVREGNALMADGEGNDLKVYMKMAKCQMDLCDKALAQSKERLP